MVPEWQAGEKQTTPEAPEFMDAAIAMPRSLAEASRTRGVIACADLLASMGISDSAY